jgi:hypothetical protein
MQAGGRGCTPFPAARNFFYYWEGNFMSGKLLQTLFILISTSFICAVVMFVTDAATATALAGTYTAVMGIYLGLDLADMIRKTHGLRRGDYKEISYFKYITALGLFGILLIETFSVSHSQGRELYGLLISFGIGFLIVCGGLIAGIEANKIVTNDGPDK